MKRTLQIAALLIIVGGLATWFATGHDKGWTKTIKTIPKVEPITGMPYQEEIKGFYPGVDFLAVTLVAGAGLLGVSFLLRKKSNI
jgi:hypothetical protein